MMIDKNQQEMKQIDSAVETFAGAESIPFRLKAWLTPHYIASQYIGYLIGCILFSFGANFFIASHLGTDPLDVFALGLMKHLPITVGIAQGGFAALMLFLWALWNKRLPIVSPFITFFLCGSLIDLWMYTKVADHFYLAAYPMMMMGVLLCAFGSSLIIMSGIGIRPIDLIAITMMQKLRFPFWFAKGIIEMSLLIIGWILDGPVGIGTLFFFIFVGWMIQPLMLMKVRFFKMRNYGLSAA